MSNLKSISVFLSLNDGTNKGRIALQKRSLNDSSPLICQATWSGKIEDGEDIFTAVRRECLEELGEEFYKKFDFSKIIFLCKENSKYNEKDRESYNYFGQINFEDLKLAKLHNEAFSNFIFVGKKDKIYPIKSGSNPENSIVLFNDEFKVLTNILNDNKRNR